MLLHNMLVGHSFSLATPLFSTLPLLLPVMVCANHVYGYFHIKFSLCLFSSVMQKVNLGSLPSKHRDTNSDVWKCEVFVASQNITALCLNERDYSPPPPAPPCYLPLPLAQEIPEPRTEWVQGLCYLYPSAVLPQSPWSQCYKGIQCSGMLFFFFHI